ncbi:hypothetical protein RAY_129 [Erwinia phage vB_EamM_RAY]|jgi:hypothetical protein|uniref:Uncharacterized protein n=10 Tax=Agricanvirus TaxID=1984776 RepID=A0A173GE60_9CAUD|nr:hypothetical protein Ea357_128 [Erwinia phage Ea35-70]YP_009605277.1 hypothetical protein FDH97_gp134 [Erwinia phage vB_EamM_Deimos-Minion]YP_009605596.1 hypothetical protein FDH98_gp129 [Erwinia phage vB_EamM_RAY]YP_009605916.1 hypothetical protein FDH99_gp132 [Erwinia phage vB_EamM_Simmy50]YP_009606237.1 hypothetical protein FDI00_gp131 [Erwinia phage vB_EamM_Special G]YP_009621870.1 hypothetical protein FDJ23_gp129 [Erwinia phage vB_EamM_Desertfox]AUG85917.1 hypothetical protein BOSOLAP
MAKKITAAALEKDIFDHEGIRVIFRVPTGKRIAEQKYTEVFTNRSPKNYTLKTLRERIVRVVGENIEFSIITGGGEIANGNYKIGNLRTTYEVIEE